MDCSLSIWNLVSMFDIPFNITTYLVIQYGFATIFVAAFPLAPLFAWINNVIEIRLDAHKFIQIFRRPLAEKAQDIGAWFYLLRFVTNLCVVTNAFLIAVTSSFIDREVYNYVYNDIAPSLYCPEDPSNCEKGFVTWATSSFTLGSLLHPIFNGSDLTSFPVYTAHDLALYTDNGTRRVN